MKHVFIMRPGKPQIVQKIKRAMIGQDFVIRTTKARGDTAMLVAQEKAAAGRIYIIGGDGMLHEAIQELAHSDVELVVLPDGTGNDFARNFDIAADLEAELVKSLTRTSQAIDLIKANDIYCLNTIAFALDGDCANYVHDQKIWRWLPGGLFYAKMMFQRWLVFKGFAARLEFDHGPVAGSYVLAVIANGNYYGGGFRIAYGKLDDGVFTVTLAPGKTRLGSLVLLLKLAFNRLTDDKRVQSWSSERVVLKIATPVNIDGETYPGGEYAIDSVPLALRVVNQIKESRSY